MPIRKESVYFHECLGLIGLIVALLKKRTTFYSTQSLPLRLVLKFFRFDLGGHIRTIWYGDLAKSTGIRKAAYECALKKIDEINPDHWNLNLRGLLQIDGELIAQKFLLDFLFKKYEFYGISAQYALEHPDCSFGMVVDPLFLDETLIQRGGAKIVKSTVFHRVEFIAGILAIPFFLLLFYRKNRKNDEIIPDNSIACEVDGRRIYDMFHDLLGVSRNLYFVIQRGYLKNFTHEEIQKLGLSVHGLSQDDYIKLKAVARGFWVQAIRNFVKVSSYGMLLFDLYKTVAHGVLLTINSRGGVYLTFEHMSTTKAVRNELLRVAGNKSIFVPYNVYAVDHYYAPEYQYNYDILCSPGELLERIYMLQKARTKIIFPTGSYSPHKKSQDSDGVQMRVKQLQEFKGTSTAITILSSGIQDETLSAEVRLMALACKLAEEPGVKVFVRPKPVEPPAKYANFFVDAVGHSKSILVTNKDYDLFDFLSVTDLFVTVWSSSAVDLCVAGGSFFSVNFWDDKDIYLWQTAVDGVYLEESAAFDSIMGWVRDAPRGARAEHQQRMSNLSSLISYKFKDFDSYKDNLWTQLAPYLPKTTS